jgi:hypothetical protein
MIRTFVLGDPDISEFLTIMVPLHLERRRKELSQGRPSGLAPAAAAEARQDFMMMFREEQPR